MIHETTFWFWLQQKQKLNRRLAIQHPWFTPSTKVESFSLGHKPSNESLLVKDSVGKIKFYEIVEKHLSFLEQTCDLLQTSEQCILS